MPYCELEPLAVVWWERRKGIATAILHEAANRIKQMFPQRTGMLGGKQTFYQKIGYEKKATIPVYHWELEVYISWEKNPTIRTMQRKYSNCLHSLSQSCARLFEFMSGSIHCNLIYSFI